MNRAEWVKRLSQFPYDDLRQKILENWAFDVAALERDLAAAIAAKEHAEKRWGDQAEVAWQIAQKHDAIKRDLATARARIAFLEEEDREWDKHSLTRLVEERGKLQERIAASEDLLNAYKNALRVHRDAERLVLMREKEWRGCQDPGYVVIDGGSLTMAMEFSKDMSVENRDNLRADLRVAQEQVAALTEALTFIASQKDLVGNWAVETAKVALTAAKETT